MRSTAITATVLLLLVLGILSAVPSLRASGVMGSRIFRNSEDIEATGFRIRFSEAVLVASYGGAFTETFPRELGELPVEGAEFFFTGGTARQWDTFLIEWSMPSSRVEIVEYEWLTLDFSELTYEDPITVMTYNIFEGGLVGPDACQVTWETDADAFMSCVDSLVEEFVEAGGFEGHSGGRLSWLVDIIRQADPDIVAIQEGWRWSDHGEFIAREVAEAVGMNYCLVEWPGGLPDRGTIKLSVLLTKFEIREAEWRFEMFGPDVLRAEMVAPTGRVFNVFNVHLRGGEPAKKALLTDIMEPYRSEATLLMGDMNAQPADCRAFVDDGWVVVGGDVIDHVWVSPGFPFLRSEDVTNSSLGEQSPALRGRRWSLDDRMSDHDPVVVRVWLLPTELMGGG